MFSSAGYFAYLFIQRDLMHQMGFAMLIAGFMLQIVYRHMTTGAKSPSATTTFWNKPRIIRDRPQLR